MHTNFHVKFGFCPWDLVALAVLVAAVVVLTVHIVKRKRTEKELEEQLSSTTVK